MTKTAADILTEAHEILLNSWGCDGPGNPRGTACALECVAMADGHDQDQWGALKEIATPEGRQALSILSSLAEAELYEGHVRYYFPQVGEPETLAGFWRYETLAAFWRYDSDGSAVWTFNDRTDVDLQRISDLFVDAIELAEEEDLEDYWYQDGGYLADYGDSWDGVVLTPISMHRSGRSASSPPA